MALGLDLLDLKQATGISFVSDSVSPTGGSVVLAIIHATINSFASADVTVDSTFDTESGWTQIVESSQNGPGIQVEVWMATATATPGSGTVTASLDGSAKGGNLAVIEITGGAASVVQSDSNTSTSTSMTVSLDSTPDENSLVIGAITIGANSTITTDISPGSGFTELYDNGSGSLNVGQVEYRTGGDADVDWGNLTANKKAAVAIEFEQVGGGGTNVTVNPATQAVTTVFSSPTVTTVRNVTVSPTALSATTSQPEPTVSAVRNVGVTPTAQSLTVSSPDPTIEAETALIELVASDNVTDGEATTAQLTPPSGKTTSDFTAGKLSDESNPAEAVDLGANDYTEMEWVIQATSFVEDDQIFEFRVTRNGTPLDTYSVTPEWTIGGAGETILAAPQTVTLSLADPTIVVTRNVTVTPDAQVVTTAVVDPTVAAERYVTISADAQTVTTAQADPTIVEGEGVSITPDAESATVAINSPTITTTRSVTVELEAQALATAVNDPTVTTTRYVTIEPDAQSLTTATPDPTIIEEGSVSISVDPQTLTTTLADPSVSGDASVALEPQSATVALENPTISTVQNVTITPGAQSVTTSAPDVMIEGDIVTLVAPDPQTATVSLPEPTVATVRYVTVTPLAQEVGVTQPSAGIEAVDSSWKTVSVPQASYVAAAKPTTIWSPSGGQETAYAEAVNPTNL